MQTRILQTKKIRITYMVKQITTLAAEEYDFDSGAAIEEEHALKNTTLLRLSTHAHKTTHTLASFP